MEQVESLKTYFDNNKFSEYVCEYIEYSCIDSFIVSAGLGFVTLYSLIITALSAGFVFRVQAQKEYPLRILGCSRQSKRMYGPEIAEFRRYYEDNRAKER